MIAVLVAAIGAASQAATVLVGSGGCDVSDHDCHPPSAPQIAAIHLDGTPTTFATTAGAPSWLQLSHDSACLFAVQTTTNRVLSFAMADSGLSGPISDVPSGGSFPVKLDLSLDGGLLFVANYGQATDDASVATLIVAEGCKLATGVSLAFHRPSIDPDRQQGSHIHTVVTDVAASSATSTRLFACDLGGDAIYTLSAAADGGLVHVSTVLVTPGSGPRHLAIHPSLRVAYVVFEMANAIGSFSIGEGSRLEALQPPLRTVDASLPTCLGRLPFNGSATGSLSPSSSCSKVAEVVVTPNGRSVYASNRGFGSALTNTIAGFRVNATDGRLAPVELATPSGTSYPRGMQLSKDGAHLFVAGQGSANLVRLAVAPAGEPGTLDPTAVQVQAGLATPTTVVPLLA